MTNADVKDVIELANIIAERPCDSEDCAPCIRMGRRCNDYLKAEQAIKAGYRRQRTASWVTTTETEDGVIQRYTHRCTDCNYFYKTVCPRGDDYCHKCGAKMKGGE